jgi:hypothetical protein
VWKSEIIWREEKAGLGHRTQNNYYLFIEIKLYTFSAMGDLA